MRGSEGELALIRKAKEIVSTDLPKEMQAHHYPILYQVEETHWWYLGRRRIIESLVQQICSKIKTANPRILDVGCGTGANLKMLARYGRAEGVDVAEQAVAFCHDRGLEGVKLGAIEQLPYDDESFDIVTALDVIEHLDNDVAGLREIRRVLCPGGYVLVFVPAFMFLWGVQDDVSNHRRRYTMPGLLDAMKKAGFSVDWSSYSNIGFFFPVLTVRTLMRWLGLRADTEYGINIPLLNRPFSQLFAVERFVFKRGKLPFGVSAVCLAKRADK